MTVTEIIHNHEASGKYIDIDGVRTFYLDQGDGPVVVCLHGVPSSSFLYRKMVSAFAASGLRAIALDFAGMGLSDRPEAFDYSWYGMANFTRMFLGKLSLKKFHLVIHDIGGPIGLILASQEPQKIESITVMNCPVEVANFQRPWSMQLFTIPVIGEIWLASLNHHTTYLMFALQAILDLAAISKEEIFAYVDLLKREDNGRAFLKIMRGYNLDQATEDILAKSLQSGIPVQAIWGKDDPALPIEKYGQALKRMARLSVLHEIPGKHFFQEDQWQKIVPLVVNFVNKLPRWD